MENKQNQPCLLWGSWRPYGDFCILHLNRPWERKSQEKMKKKIYLDSLVSKHMCKRHGMRVKILIIIKSPLRLPVFVGGQKK